MSGVGSLRSLRHLDADVLVERGAALVVCLDGQGPAVWQQLGGRCLGLVIH